MIFIFLLGLECAYILFAKRMGIVDSPHRQSSHTEDVVRGGGVLFSLLHTCFGHFLMISNGRVA